MNSWLVCIAGLLFIGMSCNEQKKPAETVANNTIDSNKDSRPSGYGNDRVFLKKYVPVIELHNGQSGVLIVPKYQGRVMTNSCKGDSGYSCGWINYDLIKSGKIPLHINPVGGEERIWLAPEGGQFSFFFKKEVPFDFDNWFTPKEFDTESFDVTGQSDTSVFFKKDIVITNRSGNAFTIHIDRNISLLERKKIEEKLNIEPGSNVQVTAYKSCNTLTNAGKTAWNKQTGAPAIWLLGMMKPSANTTIVLPIHISTNDTSAIVHDKYFGAIAADHWKVDKEHAYLKADGTFRSKVGIPPAHTTHFIGSYDAASKVLTLLECSWPKGSNEFPNSAWEEQKEPFSGDAFNAYNDGPLKDGTQLGPFYELESLSPAAFLGPGKSITHIQTTYHLQGDQKVLDKIAEQELGVGLQKITGVFRTN